MSDKIIKDLLKKAETQEAEIGRIRNYDVKTNLSFPTNEGSLRDNINLNVISSVSEFVKHLALLQSKKSFYDAAGKELGVTVQFKWGGFTYDDWLHDIKHRVDVIGLTAKKKKLKLIQDQLNELMSPEMKRDLQLKELAQQLDD